MTTQTDTPPAIVEPAQPAAAQPAPAQPAPPAIDLRATLEEANKTLASLKRERQITRALFEAGAVDLDIGGVLVERELAAKPDADLGALIDDLRKRKPLLFRTTVKPASGPVAPASAGPGKPVGAAMSGRPAPENPRTAAARRARTTGDRGSLLNYMRLRAQPAD